MAILPGEGLLLAVRPESGLPLCIVDEGQIRQAIRQSGDQCDRRDDRWRNADPGDEDGLRNDHYVVIDVSDTGRHLA